jgi:O-methyltransferase involved in polyketide biosynthesis
VRLSAVIRQLAAQGSLHRKFETGTEDELDGEEREEVRVTIARTAEMGEPWLTRARASDMAARLRRCGFDDVFHLAPEVAEQRYFAGRRDDLRAPRREQLIAAIV